MLNRLISCSLAIACVGLTFALLRPSVAPAPALPLNTPGHPPPFDDAGLSRPIKEVRFNNVGLNEAIETLSQLTGTNIDVDWQNLANSGIDRTAPVQLNLRNINLEQALRIIESHVGGKIVRLSHRATDGIITLSTAEEHAKDVVTEIYDVRELVDELVEDRIALMKKAGQTVGTQDIYGEAVEQLMKLITDTVAPEIWRDAGGQIGSYSELVGLVIITLPPENQREVIALLGRIHDALKRHEPLPSTMPAAVSR